MQDYVTSVPPSQTAAMSRYPYSPGLAARYSFKSAFDDEEVCGAIRKGETLWVPRESVPYATPAADFRTVYPSKPVSVNFTPRNTEQQALAIRSLSLLQQGKSHLFQAQTGWGKTVVGGVIAAGLGQPTLIVVHKEDLAHQWKHALINVLGFPGAGRTCAGGCLRLEGQAICDRDGAV